MQDAWQRRCHLPGGAKLVQVAIFLKVVFSKRSKMVTIFLTDLLGFTQLDKQTRRDHLNHGGGECFFSCGETQMNKVEAQTPTVKALLRDPARRRRASE
jgi:hypothetical protein